MDMFNIANYNKNEREVKLRVINILLFLSKLFLFLVILFHVFILKIFFTSEQNLSIKIESLFFSFGTVVSFLMFLLPILSLYLFNRMKKRLTPNI